MRNAARKNALRLARKKNLFLIGLRKRRERPSSLVRFAALVWCVSCVAFVAFAKRPAKPLRVGCNNAHSRAWAGQPRQVVAHTYPCISLVCVFPVFLFSVLSAASDREQNLSVLITGKNSAVNRAWLILSKEIQQPVRETIIIPEDHHRIIIGKGGATLKGIEAKTGTRIKINRDSDEIVISGPSGGFNKAKKIIEKISHEEANRDRQVLEILACYHPLIAGHKNKDVIRIRKECGVQVHIPPPQAEKDEIVVVGDKTGVASAVAQLNVIYEQKRATCGELSAQIDKAKHRYIIGKGGKHLDQIMEEFGVVVEIPKQDVESNLVKFRGTNTNLVHALTKAYELANSVTMVKVTIPQWMHRHIIGSKGSNINAIKANMDVFVNFPKEGDGSDPNIVTIEGSPKEAQLVKQKLLEFHIEKVPLEQKYHRILIGTGGKKIKEIQKAMGEVRIDFPQQDAKAEEANMISIRGDRQVVQQAVQLLRAHIKVLLDENYVLELPIHKSIHGTIIGKAGATVRKIKEASNCRIDVPPQEKGTDIILITGRQQDCEIAKNAIFAVRDAHFTHSEKFMFQKAKFSYLKGKVLSTLEKSCGVVSEIMEGDPTIITVKGPEGPVSSAKAKLDAISEILKNGGALSTLKVKAKVHSNIIGRQGASQKEIEEASGAMLIFPPMGNKDSDDVFVFGDKQATAEAKKIINARVEDIGNTIDSTMDVEPKYHGNLLARQAAFLNEVKAKCGGVRVSVPKRNDKKSGSTIKLEGPSAQVPRAIEMIQNFVDNIKLSVTVECTIPGKYHRSIIGAGGATIRALQETHNVNIKMPDRRDPPKRAPKKAAADGADGEDGADGAAEKAAKPAKPAKKEPVIKVTGRKENCAKAIAAMELLVPVEEFIEIEADLHKFVIGRSGENIRKMMTEHSVFVKFPNPKSGKTDVKVEGTQSGIDDFKAAVKTLLAEFEASAAERALNNFKVTIKSTSVDAVQEICRELISAKPGDQRKIERYREEYGVNVQLPKRDTKDTTITVTGSEENATIVGKILEDKVRFLESRVTIEVDLDLRCKKLIIGEGGEKISQLQKKHKVQINMPRDNRGVLTVSGAEDGCAACKDELLELEEEWYQEQAEYEEQNMYVRERYEDRVEKANKAEESSRERQVKAQQAFNMKNAPWQGVDAKSFPGLGGSKNKAPTGGVWGVK